MESIDNDHIIADYTYANITNNQLVGKLNGVRQPLLVCKSHK